MIWGFSYFLKKLYKKHVWLLYVSFPWPLISMRVEVEFLMFLGVTPAQPRILPLILRGWRKTGFFEAVCISNSTRPKEIQLRLCWGWWFTLSSLERCISAIKYDSGHKDSRVPRYHCRHPNNCRQLHNLNHLFSHPRCGDGPTYVSGWVWGKGEGAQGCAGIVYT